MHRKWVKTWRRELDSDIWVMPPLYLKVWHYLLFKANWTLKRMPTENIMGVWVSPGMLITSMSQIAEGISYKEGKKLHRPNKRTVMKILTWLEGNGMITRCSNGSGTVILINNWHIYQGDETKGVTAKNDDGVTVCAPHHAPHSAPPGKRDVHTTKESLRSLKKFKEEKRETETPAPPPLEEKTSTQIPSLEEVRIYCKERGNGIDPEVFFYKHEAVGWTIGGTPVRDWKALIRVWEKRDRESDDRFTDDPYPESDNMATVIREGLAEAKGERISKEELAKSKAEHGLGG